MTRLVVAPSDELGDDVVQALRALLDAAFEGDFSDDDWAHSLGGVHAYLVGDDGAPISHASVVPRRIVCGAAPLRAGYVEAVATAPDFQRHGHGSAVMRATHAHIESAYDVGVLSTGEFGFYGPLGWELWRGPTWAEGLEGRERTQDDDGGIMVLRTSRTPALDLDADIVADWRTGDVW